jgi:integrase
LIDPMPKPHLPYLQKERTRHGALNWYVRLDRQSPRVRIKGQYGSVEFMAEYQAAIIGRPIQKPNTKAHKGTLQWLVDQWRESSDWHMTATATKRQRENILKHVLASNGTVPFVEITDADIMAGRERRMKTPFAANDFLKAMRALFAWAKTMKLVTVNPALEVPFFSHKTRGHEPWTAADIAAFRSQWPLGTRQRVAMELLLWTGLRRGDAVKLGRQHLSADGLFRIKTEKTDVVVSFPLSAELARVLTSGPCGDFVFITSEAKQPLSKEGFGNAFRQWCNEAGIKKSAHGLRKAAAIEVAENGGSELELQASFGWLTNSQSATYTRNARRDELAKSAMAKREGNNSIPLPQIRLGKDAK